jgi:hypothetical protein
MLTRPDTGAQGGDGSPSADGAPSDRPTPPADRAGSDTGTTTDVRAVDAAVRDTSSDSSGTDAPMGDVTTDVATPDSAADVNLDRVVDNVPPPDAGSDVTARDVVDVGTRVDADAAAPRPDADGGPGPIDVRDTGPTCWGTPSTHDEDGDGIVDECDNCPSISNANQADTREVSAGGTADGVGDACDPRPTAGGESIFLFDGLNFTSLPGDWTNVGAGGWTATGSAVTPTSTAMDQELARRFPSTQSNYLAETAFTFTALETNGSSSLPFRMDANANGWRCVVGTSDGVNGRFFMTKVTGGAAEPIQPPFISIDVPRPGARYRVLGGGYDNTIYCMLSSGERQTRSDTSSSGESGFRSTATSATFEYLLVYRLGGAL